MHYYSIHACNTSNTVLKTCVSTVARVSYFQGHSLLYRATLSHTHIHTNIHTWSKDLGHVIGSLPAGLN